MEATLHALAIPFHQTFRHTEAERSACDSVLIRIADANGNAGWGEGAPRPYVTGETTASMLDELAGAWELIAGRPLPSVRGPGDLGAIDGWLDEMTGDGLAGAARAALEMALIDCSLRGAGRPMSTVLPPRRRAVVYSGVIGATSPEGAGRTATVYRVFGINAVKVKVGFDGDIDCVRAVRHALGLEASIRVDANGGWDPGMAVSRIAALADLGVESVEQPLPRGGAQELANLRRRSALPLLADESLLTIADALELVRAGSVDGFNLRVSKCGGLARSSEMARIGTSAGLEVQVGCQVGETAILSAAGRHFSASLANVRHTEGSFGERLLTEDLSTVSVLFGPGGEADVLEGPGLGVEIVAERVQRLSVSTHRLSRP